MGTLDKSSASAAYAKGLAKYVAKDYPAAISYIDEAIAINAVENNTELVPQNAWYFYARGLAKLALKRPNEARVDFKNAIDCKPDVAGFHYALGTLAWSQTKPDEALKYVQDAIDILAAHPRTKDNENLSISDYYTSKAVMYRTLGQYKNAIDCIRKAEEYKNENKRMEVPQTI